VKIKLFRSSTVGIDINGFKILQDPWLTDGEYFGAWSHYPYYDLKSNLDEINSYDIVYISHIHPDHCSDKTMKMIDKDIPIYIHKYHSKFLKIKLERFGFKLIELENGKRHQIAKNVFLNIFAADNCNPELCYKFTGCADLTANDEEGSQQLDTLSVIDDNKNVLMNINDCPFELAKSTFSYIKKQYENIDVLLTAYGGAGPYPQCFENLNLDEKKIAAKNKERQFLNKAINYMEELKPSYYLPFAGTYTLTGSLSKLQNLRGVPSIDFAYNYFDNYFKNHKELKNIKPIKVNTDEIFDLELKEYSKPYEKINLEDYNSYIFKNLKNKQLEYEENPIVSFDEIYELSKTAFLKFVDRKLINNINLKSDIYIKFSNDFIKLSKDNHLEVIKQENFNNNSQYVIYETDPRMLKMLLQGPRYAHWNNAEIGSHLKFYRNPNIFERNIYISMCYFHN